MRDVVAALGEHLARDATRERDGGDAARPRRDASEPRSNQILRHLRGFSAPGVAGDERDRMRADRGDDGVHLGGDGKVRLGFGHVDDLRELTLLVEILVHRQHPRVRIERGWGEAPANRARERRRGRDRHARVNLVGGVVV